MCVKVSDQACVCVCKWRRKERVMETQRQSVCDLVSLLDTEHWWQEELVKQHKPQKTVSSPLLFLNNQY